MRGDKTTLTKANTISESLRTTVPSSVTHQLGLKEGDKLVWTFQAKKGEIVVCVQKGK